MTKSKALMLGAAAESLGGRQMEYNWMFANEVQQLLSRLRDGVEQNVSLKCSCENFETVYIHLDNHDGIRVDDDHRTFQYLYEKGDGTTYVPVESLDLALIRKLLDEFRVELVDAPPDGYPSIECRLRPEQSIADAVDRVAQAIDRIFYEALRPDLK
jgi:hypothetical protein